mmetsp:Transcript_47397/g.95503  ORF Transcript_47397/g.95503 Transcript_47397/m.95503 type:complete len:177 (-) Transcript_47397:257-787(-)
MYPSLAAAQQLLVIKRDVVCEEANEEVSLLQKKLASLKRDSDEEVSALQEQFASLKRAGEQGAEPEMYEATAAVDTLRTEPASAEVKSEEELAAARVKAEVDTLNTLNAELANTMEKIDSLRETHEHATAVGDSAPFLRRQTKLTSQKHAERHGSPAREIRDSRAGDTAPGGRERC